MEKNGFIEKVFKGGDEKNIVSLFFLLPSPAHSVNSLCILTVAMIPLVTVAPRKVLSDSA